MREVIEVIKCDICGKVITPGAAVYTVGVAEKIGDRIRKVSIYSYPDFCEDCAVLVDKKVLGFWQRDPAETEAVKKDDESVPDVPDPEKAEPESGTVPVESDTDGTRPDEETVPDESSESEVDPEPKPEEDPEPEPEPKPKPPAKPAKVRKRFRHDPVEDLDAKIIALIKQGRTTDEIKSELRVASRRVTEVRRAYGLMRAPAYRQIGGASDE